jgi:DNA mismatch repair protein MutL
MPIQILPPEVASQIAAGEVVERPASVVKELLENSLDAGAGYVTITIEGTGQRLIEVADDGCGIPAEELPLAVERHATSKLSRAADLFQIETLGFRGEALASIGSVARLTLTSRPASASTGARLRVEGGRVYPPQSVGASVGTLARVEDLFYNVPARLKFLKHETTERRLVDNLVTRYALAYPHVRFHLHQEGRPALQTSGNGDRREILAALYGAEIARQMLEVLYEEEALRVQGFISPTSLTRSHRREMTFFVNGRPVQDAALAAALLKGYHTLLMVGRYPVAVLFLDIPPEAVDVNVHPTKAEVRFRNPVRIFSGVQNAIRRSLLAHGPLPGLENQLRWSPEPGWNAPARPIDPAWGWSDPRRTTDESIQATDDRPQAPEASFPSQAALPGRRVPLLRPIGQIASAYLVAEGPDGLYLIDQHAAHERVLFERLMAQRGASIPSQVLLQPATVDLPPGSARLLADQLPILARLGFQAEAFGANTFLVRAMPALLAGSDPAAALRVLVEEFEEDETPLQAEQEARIIARVCKRAAVKAGKTLSPEEQRALLLDLETCQSPRTCPHGRPTMIHLSVDLLERQFGRKGAR